MLLMSALTANAQEDITAQYVANPSFEQDDISALPKDDTRGAYTASSVVGWKLAGSYGVSDIMTNAATATDNNFGVPGNPSDGSQMYYLRHAWAAATPSLTQTIKLPKGKYRLTVDNKCITQSSQSATLVAGSESVVLPFQSSMPSAWATTSVDFTVSEEESDVTIGIKAQFVNASGGSIIIDNFKLYDMKNYVEPQDPTEAEVKSPTEGVITSGFVPETAMKADLLQMLANFSKYMVNDFQECQAPNSKNELCGCFKGENTMANDERGVRPNADLSMICAFLVKYGKPAGVTLPEGVTWERIEDIAMKSLVFAYSTHKANKLKVCAGNNYWGSTSTSDFTWESSLWAMSVAYSAFFQWDKLSETQKDYIYKMMKAECNYELGRGIPTGYAGDTKAEENGWEADILAATLGLFPNDPLAPKWFERLREFAINSYSHPSDAANTTVIDPEYDNKTVADLYKGQNLYDDYSLQNHNLFHTSYQNVVMQELGEAALALKMFQQTLYGEEKWKTNALMHHNQEVQDSILNWLALPDGELAMPNGNDWSLFLYDQITSYTTQACFQNDANALMLENMAYKYIKARQQTTSDGSWLLRADVGARRMGVEGHRVMMTYLMHDVLSTDNLVAPTWDEFNAKYSEAKMIPCQNIVRASTDSRFTTFSWSNGLKSYTGYIAANTPDKNKIVVPFRANNTGNITGWYEVSGKGTNASPVVSGIYQLEGNGYVMNGELNTNDAALNNRFAIYSTPGNAVIYLDHVTAKAAATVTAEKGGLMAISVDEMTKLSRTLYYNKDEEIAHKQLDGATFTQFNSQWVNIDNELGIVGKNEGKKVAFGDRSNNNSVMTAKVYPMYSNASRSVKANEVVDARNLVYYSNINAEDTKTMADALVSLKANVPAGWNGAIAKDGRGAYVLISNFNGTSNEAEVTGVQYEGAAPVFAELTSIKDSKATATLSVAQNNSYAKPANVLVKGSDVLAKLDGNDAAIITAEKATSIKVNILSSEKEIDLKKGATIRVYLNENKEVCAESAAGFPEAEEGKDLTSKIVNPSFDGNSKAGWSGTAPATDYTCAEHYNKTFDTYQVIEGLEPGLYEVGVQGFYRDGTTDAAANNYKSGKYKENVTFYANDSTVALVSIMTEAGKNYKIGASSSIGYVPNTMEQTASYFRLGLYKNTVTALVGEDGKLKIGLKKSASIGSDWTIFDNFTLRYLGQPKEEEEEPIPNVIKSVNASAKADAYTLQGIKANATGNKGVYIVNGKKIINK